jgi:hypothetical protein
MEARIRSQDLEEYHEVLGIEEDVRRWRPQDFIQRMYEQGFVFISDERGERWITKEEYLERQRRSGLTWQRGRWTTNLQLTSKDRVKQILESDFRILSPREFIKFIAEILQAMGYRTRLVPITAASEIDIVAEKDGETVAVAVRRLATKPVGETIVQDTLDSASNYGAKSVISVTTSRFTQDVLETTRMVPIEFWDGEKLRKLVHLHLLQISPKISKPSTAPQCIVCNLPMQPGSDIIECPSCHNKGHRREMLEWVKIKGFCPVCRVPIQSWLLFDSEY